MSFISRGRVGCWRQFVAAVIAPTALVAAGVLPSAADEPAIRIIDAADDSVGAAIDDSSPQSLDIADALGLIPDEHSGVETASYAGDQAPAEEFFPEAVEAESVPGDVAAEEVAERRTFRSITDVTANAALPAGLLPEQVPSEELPEAPPVVVPEINDARFMGGWAESNFLWSSTRFCHGPLYFEHINLERYGYGPHPLLRPFVSGAHFFLSVPALPYKMAVHPPRECIYTLGHYRPGSRAPWRINYEPCDARAAAVEAGVVVGLIFLIP